MERTETTHQTGQKPSNSVFAPRIESKTRDGSYLLPQNKPVIPEVAVWTLMVVLSVVAYVQIRRALRAVREADRNFWAAQRQQDRGGL